MHNHTLKLSGICHLIFGHVKAFTADLLFVVLNEAYLVLFILLFVITSSNPTEI